MNSACGSLPVSMCFASHTSHDDNRLKMFLRNPGSLPTQQEYVAVLPRVFGSSQPSHYRFSMFSDFFEEVSFPGLDRTGLDSPRLAEDSASFEATVMIG